MNLDIFAGYNHQNKTICKICLQCESLVVTFWHAICNDTGRLKLKNKNIDYAKR